MSHICLLCNPLSARGEKIKQKTRPISKFCPDLARGRALAVAARESTWRSASTTFCRLLIFRAIEIKAHREKPDAALPLTSTAAGKTINSRRPQLWVLAPYTKMFPVRAAMPSRSVRQLEIGRQPRRQVFAALQAASQTDSRVWSDGRRAWPRVSVQMWRYTSRHGATQGVETRQCQYYKLSITLYWVLQTPKSFSHRSISLIQSLNLMPVPPDGIH